MFLERTANFSVSFKTRRGLSLRPGWTWTRPLRWHMASVLQLLIQTKCNNVFRMQKWKRTLPKPWHRIWHHFDIWTAIDHVIMPCMLQRQERFSDCSALLELEKKVRVSCHQENARCFNAQACHTLATTACWSRYLSLCLALSVCVFFSHSIHSPTHLSVRAIPPILVCLFSFPSLCFSLSVTGASGAEDVGAASGWAGGGAEGEREREQNEPSYRQQTLSMHMPD